MPVVPVVLVLALVLALALVLVLVLVLGGACGAPRTRSTPGRSGPRCVLRGRARGRGLRAAAHDRRHDSEKSDFLSS